MNREEFKEKMNEIETKLKKARNEIATIFDNARHEIICKYAVSNNPHRIGDVVADNIVTIRIESMSATFDFCEFVPEMLYFGPILKKDGTERKDGKRGSVYQSHIGRRRYE